MVQWRIIASQNTESMPVLPGQWAEGMLSGCRYRTQLLYGVRGPKGGDEIHVPGGQRAEIIVTNHHHNATSALLPPAKTVG